MFIVKGVNIFPLRVQAVLTGLQPRLTGEFEIDFEPRLRVEVARDVDPAQYPALGAEVANAVRTTLGFSPAVEFTGQGDIASAHKTGRVLRPYRDDS